MQPARLGFTSAERMLQVRLKPPTVLLLDDFEEGSSAAEIEVDVAQLELGSTEVEITRPIMVQLKIVRAMQMFTIQGRLRTRLGGACCRCLEPAQADLTANIRFLLQRKEASAVEVEAVEDQDEVDIVDPGNKEIDLAQRLHDAIILEMPIRLYCKTDCKGLCPQCGQDFNAGNCSCAGDAIDPRWEALAKLKI